MTRREKNGLMGALGVLAVGVLGVAGCGNVAYDDRAEAASPECEGTAGGEEGTPDELSELMAELIAPRICDQVTGSFIGMPGEDGHEGTAAGLDPAVGRWWIRRCAADVRDGRLHVGIAGPGWTWLDRESTGFRVRQYLRFEAEAAFSASLHVGYDARSRIATIWLRPAPGVEAQVRPTGLVQAEATGIFSSMLGGILDLTGSSASDRAQQQAAEEGSQRLTEKLATGFTVTFQLDNEQMDFMLGQLARGQTPQRPWPSGATAWLVNERSSVWPGGVDVVGPIPEDAGEISLDVELEEGEGAVLRRVCADTLHRWLDAAWNGQTSGPPDGHQVAALNSTHAPRTVRLDATDCRSLLLVTPREQAELPVMLRYRVTPVEAPEPGDGGGPAVASVGGGGADGASHGGSSASAGSATAVRPRTVRVELRSLSVTAQMGDGSDWDMFGGEPDPYVIVTSIPQGRQLDRSDVADDSREVRLHRTLPGALRMEDFPLRFVVYDEDVAGDEVVGSADLEPSSIPGRESDMTLDIRSQGDTPRQTGTLRLRITPVD
ncbi:MAG TPA: hypothetical protein RMH99_29640 [Sandaracinaceae bacterium LLY-WYZ-13_1]|nr:hypothetical protein [Sandaracinaceae bacterium LLY-WYZ-13_1]